MKTFALKNRTGESIAKVTAENIFEAQSLFSKIKRLTINQLLQIFNVGEINSN